MNEIRVGLGLLNILPLETLDKLSGKALDPKVWERVLYTLLTLLNEDLERVYPVVTKTGLKDFKLGVFKAIEDLKRRHIVSIIVRKSDLDDYRHDRFLKLVLALLVPLLKSRLEEVDPEYAERTALSIGVSESLLRKIEEFNLDQLMTRHADLMAQYDAMKVNLERELGILQSTSMESKNDMILNKGERNTPFFVSREWIRLQKDFEPFLSKSRNYVLDGDQIRSRLNADLDKIQPILVKNQLELMDQNGNIDLVCLLKVYTSIIQQTLQ